MPEVIVWSGWIGGIAIGFYSLFQAWISGRVLGVSLGYGNYVGLLTMHEFFRKGEFEKLNNWRLWFTVGIPLGGLIGYLTSHQKWGFHFSMGSMYDSIYPESVWLRSLILLGAGIIIGLGSRMAGGCTSGHTIVGVSLRSTASIIASIAFFVGGLIAVQIIFRIFR